MTVVNLSLLRTYLACCTNRCFIAMPCADTRGHDLDDEVGLRRRGDAHAHAIARECQENERGESSRT